MSVCMCILTAVLTERGNCWIVGERKKHGEEVDKDRIEWSIVGNVISSQNALENKQEKRHTCTIKYTL